MHKFPQFLTPGWPFCIYKSYTVRPYQRRSRGGLLLSFMIPLFWFTSLINWTTSHYTGLSFPIGHFSSQDCENNPGWWSSFIQSCSRRYLFLLLLGLREVQLLQLQMRSHTTFRLQSNFVGHIWDVNPCWTPFKNQGKYLFSLFD